MLMLFSAEKKSWINDYAIATEQKLSMQLAKTQLQEIESLPKQLYMAVPICFYAYYT